MEGVVTFTQSGAEMKIVVDVTGLTPGKHGFHIHEYGDCSAPDGNRPAAISIRRTIRTRVTIPRNATKVTWVTLRPTAGKAHLELTDNMMTMSGSKSIIGRGIIVHEKADDLKTTAPTGNSGARVACGVIGIAQP